MLKLQVIILFLKIFIEVDIILNEKMRLMQSIAVALIIIGLVM